MKLRNKKTGEIDDVSIIHSANKIKGVVEHEDGVQCLFAYTLKEFNEEWEDMPEEPKGSALDLMMLTLVNFIENEPDEDKVDLEDCKQALDKLRAWKRLKDKGFRFDGYDVAHNSNGDLCGQLFYNAGDYCIEDVEKDLDLLFSQEND